MPWYTGFGLGLGLGLGLAGCGLGLGLGLGVSGLVNIPGSRDSNFKLAVSVLRP